MARSCLRYLLALTTLYSGIALADDVTFGGFIRKDGTSITTAPIPFADSIILSNLSGPALLGIDANEEVIEAVPGVGYEVPLTFTSPLIRTVDTISFSFATNNTWTGTNNFNNSVTIEDDDKLFIGDNSLTSGNASLRLDATSTGNLILQAENGWAGYVSSDLLFKIGPTLTAQQATPTVATHRMFVTNNETSTTGAIAGVFEVEFSGVSASSAAIQGLNVFSHNTSGAGNLTASTSGGGLRNRVLTRQRSTSGTVAQMSGYSFAMVQDASTATVALMTPVNVEAPTISSTTTEYRGINFETGIITGTLTTNKFIHIPSMSAGTNRYEVWLDTDAGIFFRAGTQQINSSAANTLDIDTGTSTIFKVATAREMTLTANALTFENGVSDVVLGWGTSGRLDVTATAGTIISNNLTVNGGAIAKLANFTSHVTPYELSVQSNGASSYIEILNGYGTGAGMFFGINGTGVEGDVAEIWNYQGGPIHLFTAPTALDGTVTFKVSEDGDVGIQSGKKFYLEMDNTGTVGDSYLIYDSGTVKVYVDGVYAGGFGA